MCEGGYYNVRQLTSVDFITQCDIDSSVLLQSAMSVITKCVRYYKVRRDYYKV